MDARHALRLYQDAWLFDYDSVQSFVERLTHLHSILADCGGPLSDKARIWHCLNCLEDADPKWATNWINSTSALPSKLTYWAAFSTWVAFSSALCRLVDATAFLSGRRTALGISRQSRPSNRLFGTEKDALSDASSISNDGLDTDTASYAGSYLEDGYETDYALRDRKANGSHNPTANRRARKPNASALASADPRRPRPRRKFGALLHEFTDYQFHCDDEKYFVDEGQKTTIINGERRFLIPGYQTRRSPRGLLIDAERDMRKLFFFKRFTSHSRCVECKLRHPVETYSFCRYCYFCHLGGEEECYHLHPELRGTRPAKGKYRSTLDPDPDTERMQQTAATYSILGLSEFGYDCKNAVTRGAVRKMRRRILLMPVEEQGDAVQALLQMITDDRRDRRKAQLAKLAKEQEQEQEQKQQEQEREEREKQEREKQEREQLERERLEKQRLEKERLAEAWQETVRLATYKKWERRLMNVVRFEARQRMAAQQETQQETQHRAEQRKKRRNKRPPKPKPSARGATPALPDTTPAAPSTSRGTTPTLLGSRLSFPEEPPATAVPDAATQTQRPEAPAFMKNRRRWSSMASLSTSSSEESIQQFDKQRRDAKNTGRGSRGGANQRSRGLRRHAPGRATGGAALTQEYVSIW